MLYFDYHIVLPTNLQSIHYYPHNIHSAFEEPKTLRDPVIKEWNWAQRLEVFSEPTHLTTLHCTGSILKARKIDPQGEDYGSDSGTGL